jgi:hypothetical protein
LGSILKTKANDMKNKVRYTNEDLATINFAVAFIQETMNLLNRQRDEMSHKLKEI